MKTMSESAKRIRGGLTGAVLMGAAVLAGCAGMPAPKEQIAVAQTAVNDAVRAGAPKYAPAELRLAEDKLKRALQMTDNRNQEEAKRLAEAAEVDARLAEAKATEARSREAANQVQQSLDALRQELRLNESTGSNQGG